ncbi:hypothetical protein CEK64_09915 [Xanthomonas sontii]|nr:hypothetical protein CEK64_09915 [Xanthomonas sontii]
MSAVDSYERLQPRRTKQASHPFLKAVGTEVPPTVPPASTSPVPVGAASAATRGADSTPDRKQVTRGC